jgi:hypothetical protein
VTIRLAPIGDDDHDDVPPESRGIVPANEESRGCRNVPDDDTLRGQQGLTDPSFVSRQDLGMPHEDVPTTLLGQLDVVFEVGAREEIRHTRRTCRLGAGVGAISDFSVADGPNGSGRLLSGVCPQPIEECVEIGGSSWDVR